VPDPSNLQPSPLSTSLASLPLRDPVLLVAGTAGYAVEMADVIDLSRVSEQRACDTSP